MCTCISERVSEYLMEDLGYSVDIWIPGIHIFVCVYVSACTFVFCVYVYAQSAKYKCLYVVLCCGRLFGDVILVCVCVYVRVCMYIYHSDVECVMYVYKHMMSTHTHIHTQHTTKI